MAEQPNPNPKFRGLSESHDNLEYGYTAGEGFHIAQGPEPSGDVVYLDVPAMAALVCFVATVFQADSYGILGYTSDLSGEGRLALLDAFNRVRD